MKPKASVLTGHIANSEYSFLGQYFGALPNPDLILQKLGRSVSAYRELLIDPIVAGAVRRRKAAVSRMSQVYRG